MEIQPKRNQATEDLLKNLPSEEQIFNETKEMFHTMTDEQLRLATFDLWWRLHRLQMECMELRVKSKSWWQKWREVKKYDKERQKPRKS